MYEEDYYSSTGSSSDESESPPPESPGESRASPAPSKPSVTLKLILPPLKGGKPVKPVAKPRKKRPASQNFTNPRKAPKIDEPKVPRPVKLKPLKEVLTRLVAQLKKKDDYGFFLEPVDASKVPGYSEMITQPMDLGTIANKAARNRYRTLDEFTADFRLVTGNAKRFNPPGTIYHSEAERIEAWGMDHIEKASVTVIQYATDWNLDPENEEESSQINIDGDYDDAEDNGHPYNAITSNTGDRSTLAGRSPSVSSQIPAGLSRRGPRGPYKKTTQAAAVTESLDAEGRLPGSKDGLGAFPPGSDWAETMLALKLKGKKYKTKKERMRIEKEGPPYCTDGSLNYPELEDPFNFLSALAPEPLSRPTLIPLHPSLISQPDNQMPTYPTPITLPVNYAPLPITSIPDPTTSSKYKFWSVSRGAQRTRLKEKDDGLPDEAVIDVPAWQMPRDTHSLDFGSFATLSAAISQELQSRQERASERPESTEEQIVLDRIRAGLTDGSLPSLETSQPSSAEPKSAKRGYWTSQRATEAEEYITDLVYGGVDGLAYVRSLAEFVGRRPEECSSSGSFGDPSGSNLGTPLGEWVAANVVDPLTSRRHALLRQTAKELHDLSAREAPVVKLEEDGRSVGEQVALSVHAYPLAYHALATLRQIYAQPLDMGALIRVPEELFQSEEEWAGKAIKMQIQSASAGGAVKAEGSVAPSESDRNWMEVDAAQGETAGQPSAQYELEGPEVLQRVLTYSAGIITALGRNLKKGTQQQPVNADAPRRQPDSDSVDHGQTIQDVEIKEDTAGQINQPTDPGNGPENSTPGQPQATVNTPGEDPILRNLRLNLLALAKRAPLNTIAHLPKDLVPEHIRHYVPIAPS
ncbi:hypothetical protein HGRIS_011109 [Hohenbuehelia grisea]|uniref:Bromo domain-containing protein n=1 Tax=Hohenbuehelia grisea TaxID=104357 RepID=A0ABR3IZ44_9AGAR